MIDFYTLKDVFLFGVKNRCRVTLIATRLNYALYV